MSITLPCGCDVSGFPQCNECIDLEIQLKNDDNPICIVCHEKIEDGWDVNQKHHYCDYEEDDWIYYYN